LTGWLGVRSPRRWWLLAYWFVHFAGQSVESSRAPTRSLGGLRDQARGTLGSLTGKRDQRRETEQHLDDAERSYTLHDRLAGLVAPSSCFRRQ
jgi:hypothetical protein